MFKYVLLLAILVTGSLVTLNMQLTLSTREKQAVESERPAEISIITIVASSCDSCVNVDQLLETIQSQNVQISLDEKFTTDSEEGKTLIDTFEITRVPSVLVRGEIEKENVKTFFDSIGQKSEDGTLVIEPRVPVYFDLAQNRIVGEVTMTTLADSSCKECYDPAVHQSILKNNFGLTITKTEALDTASSQGKTYVQRYAIKELPAFLLSGDVISYESFTKIWEQVGTVEQDGTFVFRGNSKMDGLVYKNLSTGEIVKPETETKE